MGTRQPLNLKVAPCSWRNSDLRAQAQQILDGSIQYVPAELFDRLDAEAVIEAMKPASRTGPGPSVSPRSGIPAYFAALYRIPLLAADEERYLFTRMNFLRCRADHARRTLNPRRPSVRRIDRIQADLADAQHIRNRLIRANLRLVVAVAKTFVEPSLALDDLVSDGNFALIRAVELFDVSRGYRFSTYATGAIRHRCLRMRLRHRRDYELVRPHSELCTLALAETTQSVPPSDVSTENGVALLARLLDGLSEREQTILRRRYGMSGDRHGLSLSRIANEVGLSKERVRQLAIAAINKLRDTAQRGTAIANT